MNGGISSNLGDTFSLDVTANAPQGYPFTMLLTVSSGTYFERTFEIDWYVGLPEWRTHDVGGMYLTVTDQGIIQGQARELMLYRRRLAHPDPPRLTVLVNQLRTWAAPRSRERPGSGGRAGG